MFSSVRPPARKPTVLSAKSRVTFQVTGPSIKPVRPARQVRARLGVRPYTLRKGDTLESIAEKRELTTREVMKLNHDMDPNTLKAGDTITLPVGKLSVRDRQIMDGMSKGKVRAYPVREGEKLNDILAKRNISMPEFRQINPDLDPKKVKANMVIQLPARKFSVREREMLFGAGAPTDFFYDGGASWPMFGAGFGVAVAGLVYIGLQQARMNEETKDRERREQLDRNKDDPSTA